MINARCLVLISYNTSTKKVLVHSRKEAEESKTFIIAMKALNDVSWQRRNESVIHL